MGPYLETPVILTIIAGPYLKHKTLSLLLQAVVFSDSRQKHQSAERDAKTLFINQATNHTFLNQATNQTRSGDLSEAIFIDVLLLLLVKDEFQHISKLCPTT